MSVQQAQQLAELGRFAEAVEVLTPLLADPSADAEPWCLLAQCRLGLRQSKLAVQAADRAIAADPDSGPAHAVRAMALMARWRYGAAQRSAETSSALTGAAPPSTYLLVMILLVRGKLARAEELAGQGLAEHPDEPLAYEAAAAVALDRRQWAEAERLARAGLNLAPHDGDLMIQLGTAQQGQGQQAQAAESFAAAVRTDPSDQRGRRALGRLGLRVGGGVLGVKAALLIGYQFTVAGRLIAASRQHTGTAAIAIGIVLLLAYGYRQLRHRSAVAQISPVLRSIALGEHRRGGARWLRGYAAVLLVLALVAVLAGDGANAVRLMLGLVVVLALAEQIAPAGLELLWEFRSRRRRSLQFGR